MKTSIPLSKGINEQLTVLKSDTIANCPYPFSYTLTLYQLDNLKYNDMLNI